MNRVLFVAAACAFAGPAGASGYNSNREPLEAWGGGAGGVGSGGGAYYRPNPFAVDVATNYLQQPSQNLFWDKLGLGNSFQGSNQVGGVWGTIGQKFPFLTSLFSSRMEAPTLYGPPATQYGPPATQYGPPSVQYARPQFFYPVRQYYPPGVQVTDDAVVVSAPGVPAFPTAPSAPSAPGYDYSRPQYRLELPQKSNLK